MRLDKESLPSEEDNPGQPTSSPLSTLLPDEEKGNIPPFDNDHSQLASLNISEPVVPFINGSTIDVVEGESSSSSSLVSNIGSNERLQHNRVPLRGPQRFNPTPVKLFRQSHPDITTETSATEEIPSAHTIGIDPSLKSCSTSPSPSSHSALPVDTLTIQQTLDDEEDKSAIPASSAVEFPSKSSSTLPFSHSPPVHSLIPSSISDQTIPASISTSHIPPARDRDPLRLSRFLAFPSQVGHHGADVHLFDGLMSRNVHDIRLLRAGYYGIRLHNLNEAAWDSLYLGIGKMKAVVEFEVIPPPAELLPSPRLKRYATTKSENASPPISYDVDHRSSSRGIGTSTSAARSQSRREESRQPSLSPNQLHQQDSRHSTDTIRTSPCSNGRPHPASSSRATSRNRKEHRVESDGASAEGKSLSSSSTELPQRYGSRPSSPKDRRQMYSSEPISQQPLNAISRHENGDVNHSFNFYKDDYHSDMKSSLPFSSSTVAGIVSHEDSLVDETKVNDTCDDENKVFNTNGHDFCNTSTNGVDENSTEQRSPNPSEEYGNDGEDSEAITEDSTEHAADLPKDATTESISVISGKGELACKAQQEKVVYFYVPEAQSSLKLQVYASLTLGMRLRCSYDLLYCGSPKVSPSNPLVPFLRNASILCLDGGGILGISSLKILERLELEIQKELRDPTVRITDCFDMICGTSTGGIISLGLLTGLSIKDMISMWASMSGRIFEGNRTLFSGIVFEGYDVTRLKNALVQGVGNRYMNTYTQPYCFVTSTDVKHNPYELFLLRNYTHSHLANHEYRGGSAIPVWAAAWATAAAPTYLKGPNPEELEKMGLIIDPEVQLCDGAMKANNPTMVALEEAARLSGKKLQHFIESDLDCCLSVGTGQPTLKQTIEKTGIVSTFQILVNSAHLLTSSTNVHRDVLHWLADHEDKYFRFNTPGIGDIALDAVDKASYDIILKATNDYLSDEKYYDIKRLVKKLSYRVRR